MRTNSCANCKHRHDMICIPESKDCAPYYFLDIEDLNGEDDSEKIDCDYFTAIDDCYTNSSLQGLLLYTDKMKEKEVECEYETVRFKLNESTVIINGVIYDLATSIKSGIEISITPYPVLNYVVIELMYYNRNYINYYSMKCRTKCIMMSYNDTDNVVTINFY